MHSWKGFLITAGIGLAIVIANEKGLFSALGGQDVDTDGNRKAKVKGKTVGT